MGRNLYDEKLVALETETLDLGYVVASEILEAVNAFARRDTVVLEEVVNRDRRINAERLDIERRVLTVIATQQPVAVDMRILAGLLEIVGEVERIGDYAKGIAKIGMRLDPAPTPTVVLRSLVRMGDECHAMMQHALRAFAARDADASRRIITQDDEVDRLYNQVFSAVVELGAADALTLERSNHLLWVAHNLERTADRVTNICERSIYVVTGDLVSGSMSAMETRLSGLSHPETEYAAPETV
jgi:phosphate transport system protein